MQKVKTSLYTKSMATICCDAVMFDSTCVAYLRHLVCFRVMTTHLIHSRANFVITRNDAHCLSHANWVSRAHTTTPHHCLPITVHLTHLTGCAKLLKC